jgi:NADH-quinone oxidoreductase subunit H
MKSVIDTFLNSFSHMGYDIEYMLAFIIILSGVAIFTIMAVNTLFAVYFERKVSAFMQDRLGPMEVGIFGFKGGKRFWGGIGQIIADGLKLLTKEDILPKNADKFLMIIAPFIIFTGALLTFIAIPLSQNLVVSDFNIGIFYIVAMSSVGVIGIILAGWSSNNKWSLYGAMRAAAQIVSYEIPIGLSLLLVVLVTGSLHLGEIVQWQADNRWFIFHSPFTFLAFFIFYISTVAETNRTPFDIPEAESELVAGWMTEYSGFRWSLFFLSEYSNMLIVSLVASIVFLGGWLSPLQIINIFPDSWTLIDGPIIGVFWVMIKAFILIFIMMWFRWTFPRLRVDQLMNICWKVLLPLALLNIFGVGIWTLLTG